MTGIRISDIHLTHIRSIDEQHRHFGGLITRAHGRMARGDAVQLNRGLLNELKTYAAFHFQSEENLMLEYAFQDIDSHVASHRRLITELDERIERALSSEDEMPKLVMFLWKWLVNHTNMDDRCLGAHLRQRGCT